VTTSGAGVAALTLVGALALSGCGLIGGSKSASKPTTTLGPLPTTTTTRPHPTTTKPPTQYIVQKGDSLSYIAQKFGTSVAALVAFNNIANADHIEEGQRLKIPPPTTTTTRNTALPGAVTTRPQTTPTTKKP
jgi:LysM repeat protein